MFTYSPVSSDCSPIRFLGLTAPSVLFDRWVLFSLSSHFHGAGLPGVGIPCAEQPTGRGALRWPGGPSLVGQIAAGGSVILILNAGPHAAQVGYMVAGMRSVRQALLGDTVVHWPPRGSAAGSAAGTAAGCAAANSGEGKREEKKVLPPALSGFLATRPMLFASLYPLDRQALPCHRKPLLRRRAPNFLH